MYTQLSYVGIEVCSMTVFGDGIYNKVAYNLFAKFIPESYSYLGSPIVKTEMIDEGSILISPLVSQFDGIMQLSYQTQKFCFKIAGSFKKKYLLHCDFVVFIKNY
jgi:hypothetical protein